MYEVIPVSLGLEGKSLKDKKVFNITKTLLWTTKITATEFSLCLYNLQMYGLNISDK